MVWTDTPPYKDLPGATDPAPTAADPGWSPWVKKQVDDFKRYNPGEGWPAGVKISLIVKSTDDIEGWAVEGEPPGPWEIEAITRTFSDPHRDLTRYRRKYSSITITYYKVWEVTVVFEFPGPSGATFQQTFTFWQPFRTSTDERWVYRWKLTSGERLVHGKPCQWYDGKVPDDWNDHPRPEEDDGLWETGKAEEPPEYLVNPPEPLKPEESPKPERPKEWRSATPHMLLATTTSPSVSAQQLFGRAARVQKPVAKKPGAGRRAPKG